MKTVLNKLICLMFSLFLITACSEKYLEETSEPDHGKYKRIAEMAEEEFLMTRDTETNTVPKEKLYKIRKSVMTSTGYQKSLTDDEWESRGPIDVGGRTRALIIDSRDTTGNTLFVGSVSGGLWKCTNARLAPNWERVEGYVGNPSISSMVQDPHNPEVMYIGTGEGWFNGDAYRGDGVYKSEDGGVTWNRLESTAESVFNYNQNMLITQDSVLLVATRDNGLLRSRDGGESWSISLNNFNQGFSNRMADIVSTPGGTLFASAGMFSQDGVYRSLDGGENWDYIELGIDSFERIDIAVSAKDTNFVALMIQDENTNGVGHIFTSKDNGDTWESQRVPARDDGSPLAGGQAWYDMSIAIDPNDSDVMFVGGVDLFKTVNGGTSWRKVTNWFEVPGLPFVHADQHSAHYINGSSELVYFSNDGGLWLTRDANALRPEFEDLSRGYVSTQYYACAIHPGAETDFYVGGSQDNGTELINRSGLSESEDIGGGDGAYCHIDQLNPDIVIRSSQRGNYTISRGPNFTNNTFFSVPRASYFINPSDYDDVDKILYMSSDPGEVHWVNVINNVDDSIIVSAAFNDRATALTVDPTDNNVLYVGTNNGRIIRVINPRSEDVRSEFLFSRNGFVRNIEVDPSNKNRLLCTYSNFNIQSVFYSDDRGENWRSLEGDLPDIPVRWGVFSPGNREEVVIATEVGIWKTLITNSSIQWENISGPIGLGRVNMLRYRESDQQMLAATYGRGLFTTNQFAKAGLRFESSRLDLDIAGTLDDAYCDPVDIQTVTIQTNLPFEEDANISIVVTDEGTAVEGEDFIIEDKSALIPQGELSTTIDVLVFDNSAIDGDKSLILNLESDQEILNERLTLNIKENDVQFKDGLIGAPVTVGTGNIPTESIFRGLFSENRTQILFRADYLEQNGLTAGEIKKMFYTILEQNSNTGYRNFSLLMGHTDKTELTEMDFTTPLQEVFAGNVQVFVGSNILFLNESFNYDGTSGLLIQICFDNFNVSENDQMASTEVDYPAVASIYTIGEEGCIDDGAFENNNFVPNFVFESFTISKLFAEVGPNLQTSVADDETAYLQRSDSILCSISSLDEAALEFCFSSELLSAGNQVVEEDNSFWVDRIMKVETDIVNNEDYELTYYMPVENSEEWERPHIEALYTDQDLSGSETPVWETLSLLSSKRTDGFFEFKVRFAGSGNYTVGIADRTVNTSEVEIGLVYDNIRYFDVLGRSVKLDETRNQQELPSGIYVKTYFNKGDFVKSEKVYISGE